MCDLPCGWKAHCSRWSLYLVDNNLDTLTIGHVCRNLRGTPQPAAAGPTPAVLAVRGAAASLQKQIPDALIIDLSKDDLLAVLRDLFEVEDSDFLDHPSFRDAGCVDPSVFPDHEGHALVTAL